MRLHPRPWYEGEGGSAVQTKRRREPPGLCEGGGEISCADKEEEGAPGYVGGGSR